MRELALDGAYVRTYVPCSELPKQTNLPFLMLVLTRHHVYHTEL